MIVVDVRFPIIEKRIDVKVCWHTVTFTYFQAIRCPIVGLVFIERGSGVGSF